MNTLQNKTIAVLPFANMSTSDENEYFADGITEEIINALAKVEGLKVTSRTSSFFFKGKNIPISQIGKDLSVSTILEGSIRLSNDTIRITAQLIQAKEDFHFWSETWDRKLVNIFEIQDEISLLIADKLREHFGHFEIKEHLVTKKTTRIDAYEYNLKAKFYANKWNPEDVKKSIELNEKALEIDPNFAEALIGLADSYSFLGTTGFMSFEEAWGKTIQFTNQALALNDKVLGVHYQLSNQAFFVECDYSKSLVEMKKEIAINPNNAEAHQFLSFLYIIASEKQYAMQHLEIAKAINPLSEETQFFIGYFHYMIEDYKKSLDIIDKCLTVNDKNIPAHNVKTLCLLKLKRYDEVLNYFDNIPQEVIVLGEKTGALALAYALKKDKENSDKYLNLLLEQSKGSEGFTADSFLFMLYGALGENDKVFEWVTQALNKNTPLLPLRYADPIVNSIKEDARYSAFQKKIFKTIDSQNENKKKELLDRVSIKIYSDRLLTHIQDKEPYLDSNLSLRSLAEQIDIHPNQLSWLLNENIGKNFNEFINHYRLETFKSIAQDPENTNLTIEGLAYDSGFNSKTVFNTYFKKVTGITPKQFLKQN